MVNRSWKNFEKFNLNKFLSDIQNEWNNQDKKFPNQVHSIESWFCIIMEEIGELAKEIVEIHHTCDFININKEIIQCITLLLRLNYSVYTFKNSDIII